MSESEKTYYGHRKPTGCYVWSALGPPDSSGARKCEALDLALDVRDHSPTGFEWGYHGSGPAQLSLALLLDATGDEARALAHYQEFKRDVVSDLKYNRWAMTREEILSWLSGACPDQEACVRCERAGEWA